MMGNAWKRSLSDTHLLILRVFGLASHALLLSLASAIVLRKNARYHWPI